MLSDIEISRAATLRPITDVARDLGLQDDELDLYGSTKAKVHLDVETRLSDRPDGKYIVVTGITPTPLGEGKTVTTLGLGQALGRIGKRSVTCIRQPSQGPTFGIKGGGAGGGYAQVVPMEELNLHLTGDMHAVGAAHNLLAAALDSRILHEDRLTDKQLARMDLPRLDINPANATWNRVVDINDRALRDIIIGLGGKENGRPRETGFAITAASEVMAILALADGLMDLRQRLGRIVVGTNRARGPVTAEDLGCAGAMAVLLKEAIKPNLMQSIEGTPVFVHTGPFGNIAHGSSSILADRIGLKLMSDGYVVTESGFGADCGLEKFYDIKCRTSGLIPNCIVLVASVRALKMHGGGPRVVPGRRLHRHYRHENLSLLDKGLPNLLANLRIAQQFGAPVVVAVNRFQTDTDQEIEEIIRAALEAGAEGAYSNNVWRFGGDGGKALAGGVVEACQKPPECRFLYPLDAPIRTKIETLAEKVYGADRVNYLHEAEQKIAFLEKIGCEGLPVNMAKTHLSLSHDPILKGVPKGFALPVRDIQLSAGAGFIYPICGEMRTMPGLPSRPAFMGVDLDPDGQVIGLS